MPSFSDRIKELRIKHKLTQKAIAQSIEISERTYISLEKGNTKPSLDTVTKVADFFHVSVDYLLGRENYWQDTDGNIKVKVPSDIWNLDTDALNKELGQE